MRRQTLIAAMTVATAMTVLTHADEVTDQLETARKAYEQGELRSAVQTLQFIVAGIQERINISLLELLPQPLEGWQADAPEAQSAGMAAMIAGTNLTRRYYKDDGAQVDVSIMADSPLMPMMTMMMSSPMLLQTNPATRIYTYGGHRGMIEHEKDSDRWEIKLLVAGKILVQVNGSGVKDKDSVEAYLKAMDLTAVEKAFAL